MCEWMSNTNLDFTSIFMDYPQSRHVFHLLYGELMLLIEAETTTTTPATTTMVVMESPYQTLHIFACNFIIVKHGRTRETAPLTQVSITAGESHVA